MSIWKKLILIADDFRKKMVKKNIGTYASSAAFFLFLSLIPMLILLCTMIPFTPLTKSNLINFIGDMIPEVLKPLVVEVISDVYVSSPGILSVAAIATLWSAGKGVLALSRGLNEINEVSEKRNYFLLRILASFYTLVLLAAVLISLLISVFGNVLVDYIVSQFPKTQDLFDLLMNMRVLVVWLVMTLLFTLLYTFVPNKKMKFRMQLPGAAFSAVSWGVFSWGFSLYVGIGEAYSTYGSLSLIIILMIWLYIGIYILLIGAQINRYFGPAYSFLYKKMDERRKK